MTEKKFFITTPIYYASGALHIGHCYTSILADALARFKRMDGYDVYFLTGSDEHGLKIARRAQENNMTPMEFTNKTVADFKTTFDKLHITYDKFIRTTDEEHVKCVEKVLNKLNENHEFYKNAYEGLYCVPCETYFQESQLVNGNCPDCGRPVEITREECYFYKISEKQKFLENLFKNNPNFLTPESRKNEIVKNFVEPGVQDLCATRTTFDWGIRVPFDQKHVVYVWIDALLNYISALGYLSEDDSKFKKYWPADVQFVGRDIARFHSIIWPAILNSLQLPMPHKIHSHGFVTLKGDKISKSKSNGFDPIVLCDKYGADAIRYYLLKEGPINNDIPFSNEVFLNTVNSDLCNDLGNLVSRTCAMILQNFNGIVPEYGVKDEADQELITACNDLLTKLRADMEDNESVDKAMLDIMNIVKLANKYIDVTTPWTLNKTEAGKERLKSVLYTLYETIRIVAVSLKGFLSELPNKILEKLGITSENESTFKSIETFSFNNNGHVVVKGEALFQRLDIKKELEFLGSEKKVEEKQVELPTKKSEITINEFDKVELKVGTIIESVNLENSDKLLKNTVQIGNETRTILSGIAQYYKPQEIVGKQVVVVTNLKPRTMRGVESCGMILCAVDEKTNSLKLVTPESIMPSGSEVC